jgi:hypothetical protein
MIAEARADTVSEESKPRHVTPYAVSKIRSEKDISKLADPSFSPTFLGSAAA